MFAEAAVSCGLVLHHKERNLWGCPKSQCLEYAWVSIRQACREAMATLAGGGGGNKELGAAPQSPLPETDRQTDKKRRRETKGMLSKT